ncbi:MAG: tetratricopeptide (TPR) repeat protein [Oceanicoccus sp.]|jgi:tetratricopeptide (TPR) repeat protein
MTILYWITFGLSAIILFLIFVRRLRLTAHDLKFQNHLAAEEEILEEPEPETPIIEETLLPQALGTARKTFLKADTHFGRKEWAEAEALLLAVLEQEAGHLEAHQKLGMLYMNQADFPNAELYFNKLINLKKDPVYFSNLGAALYQQQRLVEAAEAYENAIAMDNKRGNRLQSLAQVYHELDDHEKALKYFELAERRKPKDMTLKLILADYYENLERAEESAEMLKRVLDSDPYNEDVKARLKGLL